MSDELAPPRDPPCPLRRRRSRGFRQRQEICEELIGAIRAGGQLPPEAEAQIDPPSPPHTRLDERPELLAGIVRERIRHGDEVDKSRILLAQEIQPAFL